jgi:hypothetical protein
MAQGLFTLRQQVQGIVQKAWNTTVNPLSPPAVDYLVVAGGGSSGGSLGGGGGGGGLLQGTVPVTAGSAITVTVGAGGAQPSASTIGNNGNASVFGSITASGGGGGGNWAGGSGAAGGSGGGGNTSNGGSNPVGGQGTFGQGNSGGTVTGVYSYYAMGGGGGGAGTAGFGGPVQSSLSSAIGFNGGAGIASAILGTVYTWAGGGGGFCYGAQNETGGNGGVGGGGGGGVGGNPTYTYGQGGTGYNSGTTPNATYNGGNGGANSGGGGGGCSVGNSGTGGIGGSGIVILSYPDIYAAAAATAGSPTVSTTGSGSLYFNNPAGVSNQAVTYTTTSAQSFGSGDFCIETFVWWNSSYGAAPYIATNFVGSSNYYWGIYFQNTIQFYVYGGILLSNSSFVNNTWNHLVVCRTSGTSSMFLNGTRIASAPDSVNYATGATSLYVGQNENGTNRLNGYLSNFRIVVGNSIYNAAATSITVPTAPFAATSQTKILLNTVSPNGYLDSSSSNLTPTLVSNSGSVTWNQSSPFATGLGYKNRVYTWTSSGSVTF